MGKWTDEIVQRLRELHATHLSFAEIAATLNEQFAASLTRNSCIGKSKRIGLPERASTPSERSKLGHHKRWLSGYVKRPKPERPMTQRRFTLICAEEAAARAAHVMPLHISLFDLTRDQCRFPYGDEPASMTFCGCRTFDGASYCEAHQQLTHTKVLAVGPVAVTKRDFYRKMRAAA